MSCSDLRVLKAVSSVVLITQMIFFTSAQDKIYRLPTNIEPISYVLDLTLGQEEITVNVSDFIGSVKIQALVKKDTNIISLNLGNNMNITSTLVAKWSENNLSTIYELAKEHDYDTDTEILNITTQLVIPKDEEILISLNYTGKLRNDMQGFYVSTYNFTNNEGNQVQKILLATQFESTYARYAFPCFDEPRFKASFQISIKVSTGYGALCNTPIDEESSTDTQITFKKSVNMSSYLVAFMIYDKESYGPTNVTIGTDDVNFTTWGRISDIRNGLGDYSLTIAPRVIDELNEYTGIHYGKDGIMKKVDLAAIPDFSAGAMENWGLVTFKDESVLFDQLNGSEESRKTVSLDITHELTHQWFGNLVTLDWWSSSWLNEAFAQYFQYFFMDKLQPEWRLMEQLVVDQQMSIFAADALSSALPLTREVNTPDEIAGTFDLMTYSKGPAFVRMLSIVMGETNFQKGLQDYLAARAYKTATPDELIEILGKHFTDENAPDFTEMLKWTTTAGYPVVTFKRDSSNESFIITQNRFFVDGTNATNATIYPVYLEWTTSDKRTNKFWLVQEESTSTDALPPNDDGWFIVNNTGYFRVNYDTQNWRNIYLQLTNNELERIAPIDRATLMDNALIFAREDKLGEAYEQALAVISYLQRETDYIPWATAFNGLIYLFRMLEDVDTSGIFNKFIGILIDNVYNSLGFNDEGGHTKKLLRTRVTVWACRVNAGDCRNRSVDLLTDHLNNGTVIPSSLRTAVYCYGIKSGSEELWSKMWQKLQETADAAERSLYIDTLGCSRTNTTLNTYLEQSLSGDVIRPQDASSVFTSVYTNPDGTDVALDFLIEKFDQIEQRYLGFNDMRTIIVGLSSYLTTDEQRAKVAKLVSDHPGELQNIGGSALATIDANLRWLNINEKTILSTIQNITGKIEAGETLF